MLAHHLHATYPDFHGVTLQVGLAGLCPINMRICVSPTPINVRTAVPLARFTELRAGRVRLRALKCTGCVLLYVHIYVREDVRAGSVSAARCGLVAL